MSDKHAGQPNNLNWLLESLANRVPYTRSALLLSSDGLAKASAGLETSEEADQLAALSSGIHSLARSAGVKFAHGADVRQVVVELDTALMFVCAAGSGACLAVLADREADAAVLGYEMGMLVKQVRPYLATPVRQPAADMDPGH